MIRAATITLFLLAAAPAMAAPGGAMWTVPQGRWTCELPGDATTPPLPQPDNNFSIVPDSSYVVGGVRGERCGVFWSAVATANEWQSVWQNRGDRAAIQLRGAVS